MKKTIVVAALALAIAVVGTAVAAFPQDNVKLYTGCLNSGGNINYVAEGDSPLQPCASPKQIVKLSGGDITSVTVSAPLTQVGSGTNGAVSIGLAASATLPSCSTQDGVPKWDITTSKWRCGSDNDHTYTNGTGLDLGAGREFSIASDYRVKNNKSCDSGQFTTGIDASGSITCGAPATAGLQAYSAHVGSTILAGTTTVISKTLPPGKYLLSATVELNNKDAGREIDGSRRGGGASVASCSIPGYTTASHVVLWPGQFVDENGTVEGNQGYDSLSLLSTVDHPGGAIELKCTEEEANVDVYTATLTALRVDTIG